MIESVSRLAVRAAGCTSRGRHHSVNQDCHLIDERRGLFMVADGMGGCPAGDQASHLALGLLASHPALMQCQRTGSAATGDAIRRAFQETNQQMITQGNLDAQLHGMGTTAVLTLLVHDRLHVASMGDSRAYLLRDDRLQRYTTDHNLAQTLVNLGTISPEAAREHPWRHKLWKHLGIARWNEGPDLAVIHLRSSDRILLVTDGITDVLADADLQGILRDHTDTRAAADACVKNALVRGTHDDATAVVVDVPASGTPVVGRRGN